MPQYSGVWSLQQQMQALTSGQWATDPLFDYTTLLLQGDAGANGAQNNVFYDTSPNQFAITRNGNTTQGTFSPFSLQLGAWANYFNGSSDYLTTPDAAAFDFGTGDFTIEFFVYIAGNSAADASSERRAAIITSLGTGSATDSGFAVYIDGNASTTGTGISFENRINSTTNYTVSATTTVSQNAWNHIAVVRSGTTTTFYLNGTSVGSGTLTNQTITSSQTINIGRLNVTGYLRYLNGYLSNLRVVKGTAVYTTNFTPTPTPLTAITNTSLLTCQSNRFVDNSSNAFTITANGTPSVQAFSPFAPQYQYTASGTGGSGYFDGTGDSLSIANNAALSVSGNVDMFVEAFVYLNSTASKTVINKSGVNGVSYANWKLSVSTNAVIFFGNSGSPGSIVLNLTGATTLTTGQWFHIVATKKYVGGGSVNEYRLFVNGKLDAYSTAGNPSDPTPAALTIGVEASNTDNLNGYVQSLRFSNSSIPTSYQTSNTTVGTSIFTPPTAPVTTTSQGASNVQLLCNFTNAGILDGTMKNNLETVADAKVSTSVVKYGSGSMYFDGTGDYLFARYNPNLEFGSGDFTLECWVYFSTLPSNNFACITSYGDSDGSPRWIFYYDSRTSQGAPGLRFTVIDGTNTAIVDVVGGGTSGWAANTWYHVAITRSGSSWRLFRDGTQTGSTVTDTDAVPTASNNGLYVGSEPTVAGLLTGYIDDLRITKGIARYTQNFIPPSVALPRQ